MSKIEIEKLKREQDEEEEEDLEAKFAEAREAVDTQIEIHVAAAKAELDKAFELSMESGVPFKSSIVDLEVYEGLSRKYDVYVPETFIKNWSDLYEECGLDDYLYYEYGASPTYADYVDFDFGYCVAWAPSSMRC